VLINRFYLQRVVSRALEEDIGPMDITTGLIIPPDRTAHGTIKAEEALVLAGVQVAREVFLTLDPEVHYEPCARDGDPLKKGQVIVTLYGRAACLLSGERVALNFLQRLSGIATLSKKFAGRVQGTRATVVDTRKTTPGLRILEKYAVRVGGCGNHRFGLFDGVLIKENHIAIAGGVGPAVRLAREGAPHTAKVEVETGSLKEVREAVRAEADIIMLDNMDTPSIRKAVQWIRKEGNHPVLIEVSGRMTLARIQEMAEAGVDLISVGALIHSAPWADISMDLTAKKEGKKNGKRPAKKGGRAGGTGTSRPGERPG
jgi:nicotinate-nucleotide pyrophosphorylase (carboxylating)